MSFRLLPNSDRDAKRVVRKWVLTFFIAILLLQFWRIFSLNATYDQGLFLQEIWNGLHGRPFESTLASELSAPVKFDGALPQLGYRHLGQHFTPLLLIWTPLVGMLGIWALPLIQVGLIASAGWVLFLLSEEHLPARLAGWITCSFFSTVLVIGPSLENFHDLCQVPLLVFLLLLGISKNQKLLYFFPALLLPLVREDVGLLSFSIGLWMMARRPNWRLWGLGMCTYSILAVLIITYNIMPLFGSELTQRFLQERFGQYINNNQDGTLSVLLSMSKQPLLLLRELVSPVNSTIRFLITLALPVAFVQWVSIDSWLLISLPLFVALSSQGGNALAVSLRFVLYLVPGIFAGTVFWWSNKTALFDKPAIQHFWKACLVIAFSFALIGNPHRSLSFLIPDSINPWVHIPLHEQFNRGFNTLTMLRSISNEASVAAETHLIPQLAQRRILLRFPENNRYLDTDGNPKNVDLIVSQPQFNQAYASAFNHHDRWVKKSIEKMKDLLEKGEYGLLYCDSRTVILKSTAKGSTDMHECFQRIIEHSQ